MLNVAAVFTDHMVLQRDLPVPVFGASDGPVRVTLAGGEVIAEPKEGRFCAVLPPMGAGGPYAMRVEGDGEVRVFEDVMVGEVWLCGGQSNMEFALRDDKYGPETVATAQDPMLRFYTVSQEARVDEAMLARERERRWKRLAPGTCADVSAVAYYAGRRLRAALDVPVGMLICCIGGSEISSWISREALANVPEGARALREFEAAIKGVSDEQFARDEADYADRVARWCDAADAFKAKHPGRRAEEMVLETGEFPWPPPMGRWMLRRPGGPWETMVNRIAPYAARGLLWYQGESDSGHSDQYAARFSRLIDEWRKAFRNQDLAVVAAQLPGYGADPAQEDWPGIRRAQEIVCDGKENCALACLLDCGEENDIHPWDKSAPGGRMGDIALKLAYGIGEGAPAPRLSAATPVAEGIRLEFTQPLASAGKVSGIAANGCPAEAEITGDGALLVRASAPASLAYAQINNPTATLFGTNGLPAFPFECRVE